MSHSPVGTKTSGAKRRLNISGADEILKSASGSNESPDPPEETLPARDPYDYSADDVLDTNGNNNEPSKLDAGTGVGFGTEIQMGSEPSWDNSDDLEMWKSPDGTMIRLPSSSHSHGLGFSNLGNTCYMNAVLQSVLGLDSFVHDVEALYQRAKRIAQLPHKSLVYNFHRLIVIRKQALDKAARQSRDDEVSRLTGNLVGNLSYFQSQELRSTLLAVKHAIGEKSRLFVGSGQQVSVELMLAMTEHRT